MPDQLIINVGGSALSADLNNLQPWKALLDCADSIAIQRDGRECLRVDLNGPRRWIAFERKEAASPFACIGFQEKREMYNNGRAVGYSKRNTLVRLYQDGRIEVK